ncbi:hypothetical protein OD91_0841 [Lutibacter sp. Hel_I_33_5]|uniref:hypothetical protein n=1 Tax=Lutibacter sp. Hel_I_33_5 TaxID=1566289 RepID=UPI0011A2618C|nr:hypothetical protein [Lutibacter sp. Hel_I_33_5]TVZ55586.1 hypothetical protein OD91_0841 [Lutibacter sp. Hel_I_33_5]
MYSAPHTAVGITCTMLTYKLTNNLNASYLVGGIAAFMSHYFVDYLGEAGLKKSELFKFDVLPNIVILLIGFVSGNFWLFLVGSTMGNLMDIIDKKFYLSIFYPKKYPATYFFHTQTPIIKFTEKQTKIAAFVSILICITLIFI